MRYGTFDPTNWDHRVCCQNGKCVGIIGPDGICTTCGLEYKGELPFIRNFNKSVEPKVNTSNQKKTKSDTSSEERPAVSVSPSLTHKLSSIEPEGCPALLEATHPEVYRHNAFRVAGLSVEATPRDISRHTERLRMMQKFNANSGLKTPLALIPAPDEHALREALHKLHDPEKRLIDEFFWFWPHQLGQCGTDEALAWLSKNDLDRASKKWLDMERSSESYVSRHNLAVLYHCLALDWEHLALSRKLNEKEANTLQNYWVHAFRRWNDVLQHEFFWSRLSARIRALEDPRLTTGLSRRMCTSLPYALLSINAALAVRYAEAGDMESAKRQVGIMKSWADSSAAHNVREALRQALEPIRRRIKSICENAESQADEDPIHGDKATRELIDHTKPLLAIFSGLLPAGDAMRDAAHDEVAGYALRCQIPYGNKTENWKVSLELLEIILPIAAGQNIRDRIQENINTVKGNFEFGMCWFCQQNPNDENSSIELKMHGDVTRTRQWNGVQVNWRYLPVKVPRCESCLRTHAKATVGRGYCVALSAIIGVGSCGVASTYNAGGTGFILFLLSIVMGFAIAEVLKARQQSPDIKPESAKKDFPYVKNMLAKGWEFGEKPNTQ